MSHFRMINLPKPGKSTGGVLLYLLILVDLLLLCPFGGGSGDLLGCKALVFSPGWLLCLQET